jgi:hypothetical protein
VFILAISKLHNEAEFIGLEERQKGKFKNFLQKTLRTKLRTLFAFSTFHFSGQTQTLDLGMMR